MELREFEDVDSKGYVDISIWREKSRLRIAAGPGD